MLQRLKLCWIAVKCMFSILSMSFKVIFYTLIRPSKKAEIENTLHYWGNQLMRVIDCELDIHDPHQIDKLTGKKIIIISNHESLFDIPIIYAGLSGPIRMVAKKELARIPIWGHAMRLADVPLVDRSNRTQAVKSLQHATRLLEKGIKIWIAPEGTRTRTGELQKFKKGAFVMAIESGAVLVPVGIKGAFDILPPKTAKVNTGRKVTLNIGEPIDATQYSLENKEELVAHAEKVIAELIK